MILRQRHKNRFEVAAERRAEKAENQVSDLKETIAYLEREVSELRAKNIELDRDRLRTPYKNSEVLDLNDPDMLWGKASIADFLKLQLPKASKLISSGCIPVMKVPRYRDICARRSSLIPWIQNSSGLKDGGC